MTRSCRSDCRTVYQLGDNILHRVRLRADGAGARGAAQRAHATHHPLERFALGWSGTKGCSAQQQGVPADDDLALGAK